MINQIQKEINIPIDHLNILDDILGGNIKKITK